MKTKWPTFCPDDLRDALAELERWRATPGPQDIYSALKDWCEKHNVPPPDLD
ncbi:hypothetical protein [uncultured Tateyamaria sp.]|uniref:hypothetical protein n=1 Tax=uncultured Tateyamaria sp. TaxID=455651 RepID=UPI00260EB3AC|nr:hypothetical protein [uncultured Tateyamaria sp.]